MATAETVATEQHAREVLEFQLGPETYCVDIGHVTEIVDVGDVTTLPNSPPHVEGVMDLRGNTTTIVDPKALLNLDVEDEGKRIVVFDPSRFDDERAVGWLVDAVDQVVRLSAEDVDDPPGEDEHVRGVVRRDEEFVVWLEPRTLEA